MYGFYGTRNKKGHYLRKRKNIERYFGMNIRNRKLVNIRSHRNLNKLMNHSSHFFSFDHGQTTSEHFPSSRRPNRTRSLKRSESGKDFRLR